MTVLLCEYCRIIFEVDLPRDKINPVLLGICPDCLSKIQRGDLLLKEVVKREDEEPGEWFT